MKIVFIGYMASGKTAIAKEVSRHLGIDLIDLDAYIERKENNMVSEIFKNKGEIYFRRKETQYLREILDQEKPCVLSLGGGAPCFSGNMEAVLANATSFYLRATVPTIYERIIHEKSKRPLVSEVQDDALKEFIGKHLFERAFFYEQSKHTISVDRKTIKEVTKDVLALLG
jgi:shikimate kinase